MTTISLASAQVAGTDSVYLDTSGLMALAHFEADRRGKNAPLLDRQRGTTLAGFLDRLAGVGGAARTTVLAFEELAAATRNKLRAAEARNASHSNWRSFKQADPAAAARADLVNHAAMLEMMMFAASAAGDAGVTLEWPAPAAAGPSTLRKRHRELLAKHPEIDAMDALHIVVGLALGIRSFVTFDHGWDVVPGIDIASC